MFPRFPVPPFPPLRFGPTFSSPDFSSPAFSVPPLGQQFPRTHLPLHASRSPVPLLPSVLVELHGSIIFKENLCEFSASSFNVIMFGKLLRLNDSYGVSCLTAATQMQPITTVHIPNISFLVSTKHCCCCMQTVGLICYITTLPLDFWGSILHRILPQLWSRGSNC